MRNYLKGFVKGILLVILFGILLEIPNYINPSIKEQNLDIIFLYIFSLFFIGYIVYRYKLPKGWMMGTFFISIFILPFIFGSIETEKAKNPKHV